MNYRAKKRRDAETPDLFQEPLTSFREDNREFVTAWNSRVWLPKLIPTDRQCALIKNAMLRPFFRERWREALDLLGKCSFLILKKRPPLDLDWFCVQDNFDKIIEGKYIDEKHRTEQKPTKTARDGDEEHML